MENLSRRGQSRLGREIVASVSLRLILFVKAAEGLSLWSINQRCRRMLYCPQRRPRRRGFWVTNSLLSAKRWTFITVCWATPKSYISIFCLNIVLEFVGRSDDKGEKRVRYWIKTRGRISEAGGEDAHLAALAYMTDSYFLSTVPLVHNILPFQEMAHLYTNELKRSQDTGTEGPPEIGMMVSLTHSIYFHRSGGFRADQWMYSEMHTPWAGEGRGLVEQKIFTEHGILLATCYQEVNVSNSLRSTELIY